MYSMAARAASMAMVTAYHVNRCVANRRYRQRGLYGKYRGLRLVFRPLCSKVGVFAFRRAILRVSGLVQGFNSLLERHQGCGLDAGDGAPGRECH